MSKVWEKVQVGQRFDVNPTRQIQKGAVTPFVPMDALPTNARDFDRIDEREFMGSGQKFINGDTLIARITPCLENGKTAYVSSLSEGKVGHGSTEYIVLTGIEGVSDNLFAYYLARTPNFRAYAIGRMEGTSGRQRVPATAVSAYEINLPPFAEQKAIASVLGALDDKIESNRRMNETLEAMAQALFKDWFVDFGPTRAKMEGRKPYLPADIWSLFPTSLTNEGIPKGWKNTSLDKIANFLNGLALQKYPAKHGEPSLPVIKIAELRNGIKERTGLASASIAPEYIIEDGDFIFSWSGSLLAKFWSGEKGALNQHLFKVTSNDFPEWFYAGWVSHHIHDFRIIAESKVTTMGHIKREHLKAAKVLKPDSKTIQKMTLLVAPIVDKYKMNMKENQSLAEMRDLLLPRLMSGQLRVATTD